MADTSFLQGFQTGSNLMSEALANRQRTAQLRMQETMMRAEERERAARVQLLTEQAFNARQERIQEAAFRASLASARDQMLADIEKGVPADKALMMNFAGLGKMTGADMRNLASMSLEAQEAPLNLRKAKLDIEKTEADIKLVKAREADLARPEKLSSFAPPEIVRKVEWLEGRLGRKLAEDELKNVFDISFGAQPRAAVERTVSRADYIAKNITDWLGAQRDRKLTRDDAMRALGEEYDRIYKDERRTPAAPVNGAPSPAAEVIRITRDGRRAIFDANTKQFIRWAD